MGTAIRPAPEAVFDPEQPYRTWTSRNRKLAELTQNPQGTFGNLGMYASGIPTGMMVDSKGPRWGVALGAVLFAAGYYPIAQAYEAGPGAYNVGTLCVFSFFSGAGSASAFTAAIKTAALNYPENRGTATAFPLAAFGLSAFFFSVISTLAFADNTYAFLLLLASGTVALPVLSFPFLRVLPPIHAHKHEHQVLRRASSDDPDRILHAPGTDSDETAEDYKNDLENASLLSSGSRRPIVDENNGPPHLDVRGFALLPHPEFWQLFSMLGLLTGIGLMTINNIGNDAQALWKHYDPSTDPKYIQGRQVMHVSILSLGSFSGRLISGIGSDLLISKLNRSRFWCLFASALIFCLAQLLAATIENPKLLVLVSGSTGLAYGILFGVYPSLVAHTFGVHGLSQNWGTMTLAPVISGNVFNILYGWIYDSHSIKNADGDFECLEGKSCYAAAYWVTLMGGFGGVALCLWSVWHENELHKRMEKEGKRSDHDRLG
jgi:MFS family permease